MPPFFRTAGSFILETLQVIVLALSLFVVSYLFLFQPHQVKGNSMSPNFENNDFLLTDKFSYHFTKPARGDVIIFKAPKSEPCSVDDCEYIKRIIALPGEKVEVNDQAFYINNQRLEESYLPPQTTQAGSYLTSEAVIILRSNEYFVAGDNRNSSRDSRFFGPVSGKDVIGKTLLRYWPPVRWGFIQAVTY